MSEYLFAAKSDEVKEGEIVAIEVDELSVGLTRLNGKVCAFRDICTHDDGPLAEGVIEGDDIVCPRHGARFNLHTGKATFPAPAPLPVYEAIEEEGEIRVRMKDEG